MTAQDYTDHIVNANLTGTDGWNADGTKGMDGSGVVKCGNNAVFNFSQTVQNLPAGQYKLTTKSVYRYSGSEQDEYDAIQSGAVTKNAKMYATVGENTVTQLVLNRYDGASETDYAGGNGSTQVNGLYVPNSTNAVKAWFAAGQYVNELLFDLTEDGSVTIGIEKTAQPEVGDYTVLGPWTLTRVGDVESNILEQTIDHERPTGMGYGVTKGTVDFTAAKEFLGVDAVTTSMLRIENPDGTLISNYAQYDGWFNGEGVAENDGLVLVKVNDGGNVGDGQAEKIEEVTVLTEIVGVVRVVHRGLMVAQEYGDALLNRLRELFSAVLINGRLE